MYVLAMLTMFSKHLLSLSTSLRCFYEILSGSKVDKLLHLLMAIIDFSLKKRFHNEYSLKESSFNNDMFTC